MKNNFKDIKLGDIIYLADINYEDNTYQFKKYTYNVIPFEVIDVKWETQEVRDISDRWSEPEFVEFNVLKLSFKVKSIDIDGEEYAKKHKNILNTITIDFTRKPEGLDHIMGYGTPFNFFMNKKDALEYCKGYIGDRIFDIEPIIKTHSHNTIVLQTIEQELEEYEKIFENEEYQLYLKLKEKYERI